MVRLNKKNSGAALITVLLIVFIVMAIVSNMVVNNYRVIRRLTNQKVMGQANSLLLTAVSFGRAALTTSAATSKIDALTDIWAQPLPRTTVLDNIDLSGRAIDEQCKFNINDLVGDNGMVNETVLKQFTKLLDYINLPSGLASNIAYYMASPNNQDDIMNQYTTGKPSYRPAGRPLVDLSELLLVKGMQAGWLYKLSNYVTAIPVKRDYSQESAVQESGNSTKNIAATNAGKISVNINTASPEVIAAKSDIPLNIAQRIVTYRATTSFVDKSSIINFLSQNGVIFNQNSTMGASQNVNLNTLTTASNYFTIHAVVNSGDYEFKWVAMLYRGNRGGNWPQILWQHPE